MKFNKNRLFQSLRGLLLGVMILFLLGAFFQVARNVQTSGADSALAQNTLHPSVTLLFPVTGDERTPTPEGIPLVGGGSTPYLVASLPINRVEGWNWPSGATITVTVNDSGGLQLYTTTKAADSQGYVDFKGVNLVTGQSVILSDGSTTRTLPIDVSLNEPVISSNAISGSARADATLLVSVGSVLGKYYARTITAGSDGNWSVDWSSTGAGGEPAVTLQDGDYFHIDEADADGDHVVLDKDVLYPQMIVSLDANRVDGLEWTVGSSVTLSISNGAVFSGSQTAYAEEWDANQGDVQFENPGGITLAPGMQLSMSSGGSTKDLTLPTLTINNAYSDSDTVSGTAAANAELWLTVWSGGVRYAQKITADASGNWNLTWSGVDLQQGDSGLVFTGDSDGDGVSLAWTAALPVSDAPTLTASDGAYYDKVEISWATVSNASSYKIYRAESESGTKALLDTTTNTTYSDTGANPGTIYYYWGVACDAQNCGGYSAAESGSKSVTPPTPTPTATLAVTNVAVGKSASQSSTIAGKVAGYAIDGNTDGALANNSVSSTNTNAQAWWEVDLGTNYYLTDVKIWNRTDSGTESRLSDFYVLVSDVPFSSTDLNTAKSQAGVNNYYVSGTAGRPTTVNVNRSGRYVRVQLNATNFLHMAEVEIFATGQAPTPVATETPTPTNTPVISNIALGKTASQSTTLSTTTGADKSIDNNTSGLWSDNVLSSTKNEATPWWQVDLGNVYSLTNIKLWNRTDCCSDRLSNFYILVSDTPFTSTNLNTTKNQAGVSAYYFNGVAGSSTDISINRSGRYVRVQLSGTNYLTLAEVQILSSGLAPAPTPTPTSTPLPGGTNIALGKTASQSTTLSITTGADKSIDNNTSGLWSDNVLSSTKNEATPWWQVDLGNIYSIGTVKVWNRTDCCSDRLSNFYVFVSDTPFTSTNLNTTKSQSGVSSYYFNGPVGSSTEISINRSGRYVRVQLSGTNYLSIAEVQVLSSGVAPTPTNVLSPTTTSTQTITTPTPTSTPLPGGTNIALGKTASQSTTLSTTTGADKSIDNNTSGLWSDNVLSSTKNEATPWWQVDLGNVYSLTNIKLWNRTDCCSDRLSNFYILVSDTPFTSTNLNTTKNQAGVSAYYFNDVAGSSTDISINHSGRYVRVQLSGTNYLTLAEVQILSSGLAPAPTPTPTSTPLPGGTNIALGKTASQSTTLSTTTGADKSIDNNTSGLWSDNVLSSTKNEATPWWQVDLGNIYSIGTVKVWNRTDCCSDRLSNFYVFVSDTPFTSTNLNTTKSQSGVSSYYFNGPVGSSTEISINRSGRYVRVQLSGTNYLSIAEVQVLSQ